MVLVGFLAMLVGCGAAAMLGGRAERQGATALSACWFVSLVFQAVFGMHDGVPVLLADILYMVALVVLASRFDRSWIWVSLLLQWAVLIGHGLALLLDGQARRTSIGFINAASFGTLLALVGGAVLQRPQRRRPQMPRVTAGRRRAA